MEYTTHISITSRQDHTVVVIDDTELFDFLDDFFVDKGITSELISPEIDKNGIQTHCIYLDRSITPEFVHRLLSEIPTAEIDRIYALNNRTLKT
jgi:hypothetical protein